MNPWTMTSATLACLETCWAISNECTGMLDYAQSILTSVGRLWSHSPQSQLSDVRLSGCTWPWNTLGHVPNRICGGLEGLERSLSAVRPACGGQL